MFPPLAPIGVKFRTYVPLSCAKFHMNRCNESPIWGENADFQPVSKLKTSWRRFVASCR